MRFLLLSLILLIFSEKVFSLNHLDDYFKFKSEGNEKSASTSLEKWAPKSIEEQYYKKFFKASNSQKAQDYWSLYQELSKKKKLLKLQHESIKKILDLELDKKSYLLPSEKIKFSRAAKLMLNALRALPEGVEYELTYLKWILKNKNSKELCTTERNRWLGQHNLTLSEVTLGLQSCPLSYQDFNARIRMLIYAGAENKAKVEMEEYIKSQKLMPWENAYIQAVFYTNIGDPTSAYQQLLPHEEALQENHEYYQRFFYIAQRAGELKKAEDVVNKILKSLNNKKLQREFLYQKAFLYYQTKRYAEAIPLFDELVKTHQVHKRSKKNSSYDDLTWLRAWCSFLNKDYEKSQKFLNENLKWARDRARTIYWLAETEWKLENHLLAISYFRQLAVPVIEGKFFNYYNYMAWLKFESYKQFAPTEQLKNQLLAIKSGLGFYILPDVHTHPLAMLKEYQGFFENIGETDEGSIQILNPDELMTELQDVQGIETKSSNEFKNEVSWADDLIKWGHRDLAKWHLYELEKNIKNRGQAEALIKYYKDNEYYYRAVSLMQKVDGPAGKKLNLSDDPLFWHSIFPRAYEDDVLKSSKSSQIHPYWIWSIMKAETQYKSDAISPVGALGLMQFMPYTSQKVSVMLGEDVLENDLLFKPDVAIKYGAHYLKKLSSEMGGQLPLVAASYNGGPHRVKLWLRNSREKDSSNMEFDRFVEHISFPETRTYVKRVVSYYLTYLKIYDDKLDFNSTKWLIEKNPLKLVEPISLKEEWPKTKGKKAKKSRR